MHASVSIEKFRDFRVNLVGLGDVGKAVGVVEWQQVPFVLRGEVRGGEGVRTRAHAEPDELTVGSRSILRDELRGCRCTPSRLEQPRLSDEVGPRGKGTLASTKIAVMAFVCG